MKKFFHFCIVMVIISFPGLILHQSYKNAQTTALQEKIATLKNNMTLSFQRLDKETHPGEKIQAQVINYLKSDNKIIDSGANAKDVKASFQQFSESLISNYQLKGQLLFIKETNNQILSCNYGSKLGLSSISNLLANALKLRIARKQPDNSKKSDDDPEIQPIKEKLEKIYSQIGLILSTKFNAFFPVHSIFKFVGADTEMNTRKIYLRNNDSVRLIFSVGYQKNQSNIIVLGFFDLTNSTLLELLNGNVKSWDSKDIGLTYIANPKLFSIGSEFFRNKINLLRNIRNRINNAPSGLFFYTFQNHLIAVQEQNPINQFRSVLVSKLEQKELGINAQVILAIIGLLTCLVAKFFAEKIFLGRGPDISLKLMVSGTFILLIILPLSTSFLLSKQYINNRLKKEKIATETRLFSKLNLLDKKTATSLKETLNMISSFNTIEKITSFTELATNTPFEELIYTFVKKLPKQDGYNPITELTVYSPGNPTFQFIAYSPKEEFKQTTPSGIVKELFLPKFIKLLNLSFALKKKNSSKYDASKLKAEMYDDMLLGIFGNKTFYTLQDSTQTIIQLNFTQKTNICFGFPIYKKGKLFGVFIYLIGGAPWNKHFPAKGNLATGTTPLFICDGALENFSSEPLNPINFKQQYPQLFEASLRAYSSDSMVTYQDFKQEKDPIIIALPAKHSDYIISTQNPTRSRIEIEKEQQKENLKVLSLITLLGLIFSIFGIMYFLQPIQSMEQGVKEIINEHYQIRLNKDHPDEFSTISHNFNELAKALEEGTLIKQFVPESLKTEISQSSKDSLKKTTVSKEVAIIFSGFDNFSKYRSELNISEIHELLQGHLEAAVMATEEYGGEIEKMIEDKIMIVFDFPSSTTNQPWPDPVKVALSTQQQMKEKFNQKLAIGINSGTVISGIMGSTEVKLAKTVIGDPVNLAARLSAMAANCHNSQIVISDSYKKMLPVEFSAKKLPFDKVKGKTQTIEAYEII